MFDIKAIQLFGVLIAVWLVIAAYRFYRAGNLKKSDFLVWSGISVALILLSFFPTFISLAFAPFILGRGLDAFLVLGLLGTYAILFKVYVKLEESNRQITELTRKLAIEGRARKR